MFIYVPSLHTSLRICFPYRESHWDNNITSYGKCKSLIQQSAYPSKPSCFGITDFSGLKLLTQMRVEFNDLRINRSRHGFSNFPIPLCACGPGDESTSNFLY